MSTDGTGRSGIDDANTGTELRAVVERYEDAPNQCTIYPADADDHERMATWITASEPAFVNLTAVR